MIANLELMTFLGPAQVLRTAGNRIQLELPDEQPWAVCALAFPYQPEAGDTVLAIGKEGEWYVIGLIKGEGTTRMQVPGDLQIHAAGRVEIKGGKGIRLRSPVVQVLAGKCQVAAKSLVERLDKAARTVRRAFHLVAGQFKTTVVQDYRLNAGRIVEKADEDVKIDGKKIHLG